MPLPQLQLLTEEKKKKPDATLALAALDATTTTTIDDQCNNRCNSWLNCSRLLASYLNFVCTTRDKI
jgi:hypothetical protein